jgi:hypothetical protein
MAANPALSQTGKERHERSANTMCDYSLMVISNRLAEEGENLVAHRFPTGSVGFASSKDLCKTAKSQRARPLELWLALKSFFSPPETKSVPAVCVPPGARLLLQDIPPHLQHDFGVDAVEEVTFTQRGPAAYTYRDAIRFTNGEEILLQELGEGQRVKVLDLSSAEVFEAVNEERLELAFRRR